MNQEKKCTIGNVHNACMSGNCKACVHNSKYPSGCNGEHPSPSWQTRERETLANWLNEPSVMPVMPRSEIELGNYLISRISAVQEEIAKSIESLPDTNPQRESDEYDSGLKDMKKVAARIARGSTK